jgi:hypothetical protein
MKKQLIFTDEKKNKKNYPCTSVAKGGIYENSLC